jgi:hypothetical protein
MSAIFIPIITGVDRQTHAGVYQFSHGEQNTDFTKAVISWYGLQEKITSTD